MKRRKIYNLMVKIGNAIKRDAFPLVFSCWISFVFTERLVFDKLVWTHIPFFPNAVFDTAVIFVFLFIWLLGRVNRADEKEDIIGK